jgi:UDP-glucose 4-epimerase
VRRSAGKAVPVTSVLVVEALRVRRKELYAISQVRSLERTAKEPSAADGVRIKAADLPVNRTAAPDGLVSPANIVLEGFAKEMVDESVLVTGGLGFVGQHVVAALVKSGHPVVSYNRDYTESSSEGVQFVQGELYELPRLVDTMRRHRVKRLIHTAAMSNSRLSIDLPITTFTANVEGTLQVFESARMAGVRRVVNLSTERVYGNVDGPVTEETRLQPTTPYGVTKVTTELLGDVYNELYGLDVISLRLSEIYGPGNRLPEILRDIIKALLRGEPFVMDVGGDHEFHFVHVTDVARAAILAAFNESRTRSVFNISGARQVTLREAVALLRVLFPDGDIRVGKGYLRLERQGPWDISAAKQDLKFVPRYSLEQGLKEYADWLRSNPY